MVASYYVRRAAYESLSKMGFGVASPVMFEPGQAYRSLWPVLIVIGCAVFGVGIWVSRRFWRGRDREAPPARQIWLAGAVGCGFAAISLVALDWRSRSTTDDAFLMLGDSAHQFTSLPGRLRYAVVFDWRTPAPPTVASLPVRQGGNWKNPMYDSYPQVSWAWERWGLGYLDVNVAEPHQSRQRHRCRAVVIPFWFVATLFGGLTCVMLPLWRRSLRRVREGLCPNCGYDLRASAERCPECGRAIISPVCRSP